MMEIKYKDYFNKVHGGWLGKCIGGAAGAKQENNKSLMNYTIENVFPEVIPPNDDFDLQVLWLKEVLAKKGSNLSSSDLADAFAKYNLCLANEYSVAIKNIELGIEPPLSGIFNNDFFKNSMGCPIRSEIWGLICPGNPEAAVHYAEMDGMIDHDMESICGEQFFAALESYAFFENDIVKLIQKGLEYIPQDTKLFKCVKFAMNEYFNGTSWIETREKMVSRFGSCDASYSIINIGITIIALLYGEGDFEKTLLTAVNSGYDTDCTAATACAILGLINGADSIPSILLDRIGNEIETGSIAIEHRKHRIIDLVKETCEAGLSLVRDGVISIRIAEIPENAKASLPFPIQCPAVDIDIKYNGMPSIGYGEKAVVTVTLKNTSKEEQSGILFVKAPESLLPDIEEIKLRIPSASEIKINIDFEVKAGLSALPQKNITTLKFVSNERKIAEKSFGLSGAYRMKLIGSFFDNYDTEKYDKDPYKDVQQRFNDGSPDLFSMFNGYVNIHKPYIDETFSDIDYVKGEYVNFHTDSLEINEKIGYKGPCCVYLIYDFICPEDYNDAAIFIGNNDAYKVWLNNELILESTKSVMYMIYNNYKCDVYLRKGLNRIIIKVARTGKDFEFSCLIRNVRNNLHWFVDLASVIEKR